MLSEGRGPERMARALMLVVAGWTVLGFVGGGVCGGSVASTQTLNHFSKEDS